MSDSQPSVAKKAPAKKTTKKASAKKAPAKKTTKKAAAKKAPVKKAPAKKAAAPQAEAPKPPATKSKKQSPADQVKSLAGKGAERLIKDAQKLSKKLADQPEALAVVAAQVTAALKGAVKKRK